MKVTVTLDVTIKVKNPDGYPDEFDKIEPGGTRNKREKQVLVAHARAVRAAEKEVIDMIKEELDLKAKKVK